MVIVTTLNNSEKHAKKIARSIKAKYSKTQVGKFPDNEIYIKYNTNLKGKKLIIVESLQPNPNKALLNVIWAAKAAKMQGAKKIIIIAPYLGFMRQDKMFNSGEAINAQIMSDLMNKYVDKLLTIDPHLHRIPKMKDVFTISAKNLTANSVIAKYVKKTFKKQNLLIMGPDWESYQWADKIAAEVGVKDTVLHKDRHTTRNVDVKLTENIDLKGKDIVIVDDIISTGNTMIKAAIKSKKLGAKSVHAIGVHGLFVENGLKKMKKHFNSIVTVDTIKHETNAIDISPVIIKELKKRI